MNAHKLIAAVVAASIAGSAILPAATAHAQDRYGGGYTDYRYHDDYRPRHRYREFRGDAPRRFHKRRHANRRYYDDVPVRKAKPKYHAPNYAQLRKRKKRKKIKKWLAIGAGILALGIIANAANKKHR